MTTLTEQMKLLAEASAKLCEMFALWGRAYEARNDTKCEISGDETMTRSVSAIDGVLKKSALLIEERRNAIRKSFGDEAIRQTALTDGSTVRKVACARPNDWTDNAWITEAVYKAVAKQFPPSAVLRTTDRFAIDVLNRQNRIVATVNPL